MEDFKSCPCFCPICGSIFPSLKLKGNILCYNCKTEFSPDLFGEYTMEYSINFNAIDLELVNKTKPIVKIEEAEGPIVERKCSKCGHENMSYATLQLRSADEGQTVFFTCISCKYKEAENS